MTRPPLRRRNVPAIGERQRDSRWPEIVPGELSEEAALTGAIATALATARDVVFDRRAAK